MRGRASGSPFTTPSMVVNTRIAAVATANGTIGRAWSVAPVGLMARQLVWIAEPSSRSAWYHAREGLSVGDRAGGLGTPGEDAVPESAFPLSDSQGMGWPGEY